MPARSPLAPEVFGRIENKDYSIEKVLLQTLPGYYLGGNLYRPIGRAGKLPGVLTPHGHWTYGRLENQTLCSVPARAISLARQGYVVFSYDMVGYNDTVQTPHAFGNPREQLLHAELFGSDAFDRRDGALQHVIPPAILTGSFDGHDVAGLLHDADDVGIASFVETERAELALGDVEATAAPRDPILGVLDRSGQALRVDRIRLQEVERDALRRLGPDSRQAAEFVDEVLHGGRIHL